MTDFPTLKNRKGDRTVKTASYLYAPDKHIDGKERCFYCGISCDESHTVKDNVKPTFTNFDEVVCPASKFVCGPCLASTTGLATTTDIDGETRTGRAGAPRMYSWILSEKGNSAFNKKHLEFARQTVLDPPDPPFAIVLAESGQKQLIFRTLVNHDRDNFIVQLEDKRIHVERQKLSSMLELATMVSAAIGKKALQSPVDTGCYFSCVEFWGDEEFLEQWINVHSTPTGQLAAWLCKGRDDARIDERVSRRISEKVGVRPDNPAKNSEPRKCETTRSQLLFDFA